MALSFSIVTPCHRQNTWLRLCTKSIADQRSDQLRVEHVIQDTGDAAAIAADLEKDGARLILERDNGMYDALNRGFSKSGGDILAWLNSDEQYLVGALSQIQQYFEQHASVDVVVGQAIVMDAVGRALCYRKPILPPAWLIPSITLPFFSCATFFRRSIWDSGVRLRADYRLMADSIFFHEMMRHGTRWATLNVFCSAFAFLGGNLGVSSQMPEEFSRWRGELGIGNNRWRRTVGRFGINAQRVLKGALREREVSYQIFTPESPEVRKHFHVARLTGKWNTTPVNE